MSFTKIAFCSLGAAALLGLAGVGALAIAARTVATPDTIGVRNGRLAPCPSTPNCVSTQAEDALHRIEPIAYSGSMAVARDETIALLRAQPRAEIATTGANYIHAVFRSPTMRFPDDVEFYFDEATALIHFRAAARLGSGDMGVNRARMTQLSAELAYTLGVAR